MEYKGYNVEVHYDQNSWNRIIDVSAHKKFEDGSVDIIWRENEEKMREAIDKRTDADIIKDHYEAVVKRVRIWDRHIKNGDVSFLNSLDASEWAYIDKDYAKAIKLLKPALSSNDSGARDFAISLIKHLQRIAGKEL